MIYIKKKTKKAKTNKPKKQAVLFLHNRKSNAVNIVLDGCDCGCG